MFNAVNASIIMTMMAMMTTMLMTTMMMLMLMMIVCGGDDNDDDDGVKQRSAKHRLGQVCKKMLEGAKPIKEDTRDLQFQFRTYLRRQ